MKAYMNLKEAAAYTGLSARTLRRYTTDEHLIPFYRPQREILIKIADIDKYMESIKIPAVSLS